MREGSKEKLELVGRQIIDASMRVHTQLGPGLLEGTVVNSRAKEV